MSLPRLVDGTLTTIPAVVPYLKANPHVVKFWQKRLAALPGFRVGVVWRGNPKHKNDRNHSLLPEQFAKFLDQPGISIVSLQKDSKEEEIEKLGNAEAVFDARPDLIDLEDTAAVMIKISIL